MERQLNILVYYPANAPKRIDPVWLYGFDIIQQLITKHLEWKFKIVDGKQLNVYDGIDIYLRPNRHDGASRMIEECKVLGIPYIWSYETGKYIKPNINEIEKRIKEIERSIKDKV